MRSKTNFCNIAVILLVLVSVGCAMRMYEGAAISPKKIAVIDTQATNLGLGYWMWPAIVSIDGKSTGKTHIERFCRITAPFGARPIRTHPQTPFTGSKGRLCVLRQTPSKARKERVVPGYRRKDSPIAIPTSP